MKVVFGLSLCVMCLVGITNALEVVANSQVKAGMESFVMDNKTMEVFTKECRTYYGKGVGEWNDDLLCYRRKMNEISISKTKACTYKDGLYRQMLQFNWLFDRQDKGILFNDSFVKISSKLYYTINNTYYESAPISEYLYVYDCKNKQVKQLMKYNFTNFTRVDIGGKKIYLSKVYSSGPNGYNSPTLHEIDTKTNKVTLFELVTRVDVSDNNKVISSSFKWGTSLKSIIMNYIKAYEGLATYQSDFSISDKSLLDRMSQLDLDTMNIIVKDVSNGIGKIVLQYPGFDVTGTINFNTKIIQ